MNSLFAIYSIKMKREVFIAICLDCPFLFTVQTTHKKAKDTIIKIIKEYFNPLISLKVPDGVDKDGIYRNES